MGLKNDKRKLIVAAIDAGKHSTKYYTKGIDADKFRTTVEEVDSDIPITGADEVFYNGKRYKIGHTNKAVNRNKSKATIEHTLAIYLAIVKMGLGNEQNIAIAIGSPADIQSDVKYREECVEQLRIQEPIDLTVNNVDYSFTINRVVILPESSGLIYRDENYDEYCEDLVGIIDLGGLNAQGVIYEETNPIPDSVFVVNEGTDTLEANIKAELNKLKREGVINNYQEHDIRYNLKYFDNENKCVFNEKERLVVANIIKDYLGKIFESMERNNWGKNMRMIFTGGGSLVVKSILNEMGYSVSKDPVFDNCIGFYEVGVEYFG